MTMKTYQANEQLANELYKFGFIDTISLRDKKKGKLSLKFNKYAQKEIYFDYINIVVIHNRAMETLGVTISEEQLKQVLLFFMLKPADCKVLLPRGYFDMKLISQRLQALNEEVEFYEEGNYRRRNITKERILEIYKSIEFRSNEIEYKESGNR